MTTARADNRPLIRAARSSEADAQSELRRARLAEAFNLTNRANVVTRNANFGAGAYPDNPSPTFGQITAVGEPRSAQFGLRVRF